MLFGAEVVVFLVLMLDDVCNVLNLVLDFFDEVLF